MAMEKRHLEILERLDRIEVLLAELVKDPPVTMSVLKDVAADRPAPRVVTAPKTKKK
jgi:hypothetical protein